MIQKVKGYLFGLFKNLSDRNSRLQFLRNFNFSHPIESFGAITDWIESEAGTEFSSIEKNVKKMLAGRDSDTITGTKDTSDLFFDRKPIKSYSTQLPSANSTSNLFGARNSSGGTGGGRSTSVETGSNISTPKHQGLQTQGSQGRGFVPVSQSLIISSSTNYRNNNQIEDQVP